MAEIDSYTKLMLHCNGVDGSTTFTDDEIAPTKAVTPVDQAQIDTAQSQFGGASCLLDGAGDYLSIADSDDFYFAAGDFTIDFWMRINALPGVGARKGLFNQYTSNNARHMLYILNNSGTYQLVWKEKDVTGIFIARDAAIATGTWYHVAVVRYGNIFRIFLDGTQLGTDTTNSDAFVDIAAAFLIGIESETGAGFNGWIDEFRISKGIARWTGNFTPPTEEYSNPTQTKTILSDTKIKVLDNQQTILSDALITSTVQKTILSDTKIKAIDLQENIVSNAKVIDKYQETILSDAEITNARKKTITSDARILVYNEEKVNTDFRTRIEAESLANMFLATQFGAKISCDFRTRKDTESKISTDLRFTLYAPDLVSLHPLARTDFHVYVDDIELGDSDLKLDSIKIVHSADNKSNAEFVLLRKHDDLNNPTTITANNVVKIYLKTKLEFTGRIVTLDTNSEEESVNVKCETDIITEDYNIVTKELPLTVLNTQIHLYDILINDVSIQNYYPSTKLVIVGEGKYWTGTAWTTRLSQALTFDDFATAQDYIESRIQTYLEQYESEHALSFNIPVGHLYTYTDFDYYIHEDIDNIFLKKVPTVENYEQSPQYYKGVMIDLGKETRQQIFITYVTHNTQVTAQKVEDGTFKFLPNYTYFWRASVNWFDWNGGYRPSGWQYIGTSLGSLSTDLYEITGADYRYQRILDDYLLGLGFYTLGTAPFKSISLKNGKKITRPKWVDKEDGLYYERDDGYDYESYDKQIAALEYDKLKNINGDISPISSANLDLTIDGYLYYALKLLTRINIANTTTVNIYKNSNGFPVSIKQISIDSSTMKVNLVCDNQKSEHELEIIDGTYPDEPEEFGEFSQKYYTKFDLSNWEDVDE